MFAGRRIVLGVTGGIAAYKAVEVCRRLVDAGAHVAPIMTKGASHFIGETTLSALASEPVQTSLWDESSPIPHTRLGQTADLIIVAPATARLLSDYATGRSSDLLMATLLATTTAPQLGRSAWASRAKQAQDAPPPIARNPGEFEHAGAQCEDSTRCVPLVEQHLVRPVRHVINGCVDEGKVLLVEVGEQGDLTHGTRPAIGGAAPGGVCMNGDHG